MPPATKDATSTTCQERAYGFVKSKITGLGLKPGQYVTDIEIAEELEMSRTPVREALRRLEQEGLLVSRANRGWRVQTLTLEDIREIFDIKESLEGVVARRAASCFDKALRKGLGEALKQMRRAADREDFERLRHADHRLHEILFAMGSNTRAARIIRNLNDQWQRLRAGLVALQGRMARTWPEHEEIVRHVLAGDGRKAEGAMRRHLNSVRQELVDLLRHFVVPYVGDGL